MEKLNFYKVLEREVDEIYFRAGQFWWKTLDEQKKQAIKLLNYSATVISSLAHFDAASCEIFDAHSRAFSMIATAVHRAVDENDSIGLDYYYEEACRKLNELNYRRKKIQEAQKQVEEMFPDFKIDSIDFGNVFSKYTNEANQKVVKAIREERHKHYYKFLDGVRSAGKEEG